MNQKSKSAWKREKQQAKRQADKQRSESAPDLRFLDGLEDDLVLDGALMVVDAIVTTYRWTPERSLWMPVRAQVMVVDASNHSGWDPGRDFWRSLRHREEAPPDGFSACETFRVCPDCDGDVGVIEDAPSDASSDIDLPPLGVTSSDDDSDYLVTYVLVCSITSIESLAGFREFWFCRCPWRVLHYE